MLYLLSKKPTKLKILGGPFKGAPCFLNPAYSKRKIFGLYENCLNAWITKTVKGKQFVMDVGANNGYDTYGFAHALLKNQAKNPFVLSIEPETNPELTTPRDWDHYKNCQIIFSFKYAGNKVDDKTTTIDHELSTHKEKMYGPGLIKIDIEGWEKEALEGAQNALKNKDIDWLIEIHGKELIPIVAEHFVKNNRPFLIKELDPLPFIGKEQRIRYTTWLVTI